MNFASFPVPVAPEDVRLLIDDTAWDPQKERRVIRQEIFDDILAMISRADQFIYLDLFLWNPWQGSAPEQHRKLSSELAEALIRKKRSVRDLDILVLSDPINRIYGGHEPGFFKEMSAAGIPVVFTDLDRLPDSNSLYAPCWSVTERLLRKPFLLQWSSRLRFENPFDRGGDRISALQMGRMLRFKANHRKVVITASRDQGLEMSVGSLNPADGSSAHSNLAIHIRGRAALEALRTELIVLRWSLEQKSNVLAGAADAAALKADAIEATAQEMAFSDEGGRHSSTVQWLTEGAIADAIVETVGETGPEDQIRIAMFYLSERAAVKAVKGAILRGASVRLILDANRDAFGMKKTGVPNRPVAAQIMELSGEHDVDIRWADTHGEQFHAKAMSITFNRNRGSCFIAGSANWTRRNIGNHNMEADLLLTNAAEATDAFNAYFDRIWSNSDGLSHTLPFEAWAERGLKGSIKRRIYRLQEGWGLGTF